MSLLKALEKTKISGNKTKIIIGKKITKEFANPETPKHRLVELLQLAYQFNIPQFDEMLTCFKPNITI